MFPYQSFPRPYNPLYKPNTYPGFPPENNMPPPSQYNYNQIPPAPREQQDQNYDPSMPTQEGNRPEDNYQGPRVPEEAGDGRPRFSPEANGHGTRYNQEDSGQGRRYPQEVRGPEPRYPQEIRGQEMRYPQEDRVQGPRVSQDVRSKL